MDEASPGWLAAREMIFERPSSIPQGREGYNTEEVGKFHFQLPSPCLSFLSLLFPFHCEAFCRLFVPTRLSRFPGRGYARARRPPFFFREIQRLFGRLLTQFCTYTLSFNFRSSPVCRFFNTLFVILFVGRAFRSEPK